MTAFTRLWHYRAMVSNFDLFLIRGFVGVAVLGFVLTLGLAVVHVIKNHTPKH